MENMEKCKHFTTFTTGRASAITLAGVLGFACARTNPFG
jgi:hypothetical protein